jgi:periplasmic protein TonB
MPDPARIAEAQALEVPVVVQGATTAAGTDRRELFAENAKTTLVFGNGAVLNLRTKLTVGQVVFLHNEQNGKEVLCHVVETPNGGEPGHTDLKFADAAADFWRAQSEQPEATAGTSEAAAETPQPAENPAATEQPESPAENLAMMGAPASSATVPPKPMSLREELVAAHEVVPEPPTSAEPAPDSEPTGEEIDAALQKLSAASVPADSKEPVQAPRDQPTAAGPGLAKEKANGAPLTSDDAKHVTPAKNSVPEKAARNATPPNSPEAQSAGDAAAEEEIVPPKVPLAQRLTTGKTAVVVQVATCVVIAVSLFFIWQAVRGVFIHDNAPPVASAVRAKQNAPPTAAPRPSTGSSPAATATAAKPPQVIVVRESPVRGTNATATKPTVREPKITITESAPAPAEPETAGNNNASATPDTAIQSKHLKSNDPGLVPARILTQSQPALPPWAKGLEVDGVVTLDAVIDEKGNAPVSQMKVLSGPRLLQSSAKQAVQLWLFQPALSDGKPTATHIILTVEFQH